MSTAAVSPPNLSHEREAGILWRLRWRLVRTSLVHSYQTARLRVLLVVVLSTVFWAGLFVLFFEGFRFLIIHVGGPGGAYHAETVRLVFHVFFASLNVMLVFSSGIIFYGALFRSEETAFLLSTPVRAGRIVLHKFQDAVFFSSWGFFLLGSPMLLAYGIVTNAPWTYYALMLPLMATFVYIPCCVGALACLGIVRWLPKVRKLVVGLLSAAVIGISLYAIWQTVRGSGFEVFGSKWFQETLERFRFTRGQWLPSTWLAAALLEAGRRGSLATIEAPWSESLKYLSVLTSNAMLLHLLVVSTGARLLLPCYSLARGHGGRRFRQREALIDRLLAAMTRPIHRPMSLLLVKDLRLFRRDPVQWSQFLIFFGLLALYFMNLDRFDNDSRDVSYRAWINIVSFLNLAVVGLILSTFTTRFIYPMLSLEGSRFWILGLVPVQRDVIVWSKFVFAAVGSWIPSAILILISDLMLRVEAIVVLLHQLTCILLCLGLASISVGLGAAMPNVREQSPAKVAAGFGGTLSLVLSASFILVIVSLTALPCHFYTIAIDSGFGVGWIGRYSIETWMLVGVAVAILLTTLATYVPMRVGLREFRRLEA